MDMLCQHFAELTDVPRQLAEEIGQGLEFEAHCHNRSA